VTTFNELLSSELNHLTHLRISNCEIGEDGAELISKALIKNKRLKLQELRIAGNSLKADGCEAISDYIATIDTLERLDIH
jgi:Ran GTPase-activating protein (RanGAP) involved in mRNA processing and transport